MYVYVATNKVESKVGRSIDPVERRKGIKGRQSHLSRVVLVKTWHRPTDANAIEWLAKQHLQHARLPGTVEWFAVLERDAIEAVEQAIRRVETSDFDGVRIARCPPSLKLFFRSHPR